MTLQEAVKEVQALLSPEAYFSIRTEYTNRAGLPATMEISIYSSGNGWTSNYSTYREAINALAECLAGNTPIDGLDVSDT